jgi:SnoaL-like protein
MTEQTNIDAAEKLFAAWERWDLDTVGSLVADGAIDRRPQSGEEFVGRANIMAMYHEVPGPPDITWRSIRGGPAVCVAQGIVEYGEGPVHIIGVVEFADGMAVKSDYYFAAPFEPPESRARWAGA